MNEQQAWVEQVAELWDQEAERAGCANWRELSSGILLSIAAGHPLDRLTWPPNNPDVGKVGLRVQAWPHDPGANGEDYHSGHLPAADAARVLRDLADRCDSWADPECPWPDEHSPARPEQTRQRQEQK